MREVSLYNGQIQFQISDEDEKWLCENVFFSSNITEDLWRMEFVSGTGITLNKPSLWGNATKAFAEYVQDLREIKDADINGMARNLIENEEECA